MSEDQTLDGGASLDKQSKNETSGIGMSAQKSGPATQMQQAASTAAATFARKTNQPTAIPQRERYNPAVQEEYEGVGSHLSLTKTFKGHLCGVTSLSYNPKKDIIATGSDDTTWKLWSIPNGDLIMSGEGHIDWVGGVEFHPKGNLLATASGDGTVKIWDFVKACCAQTFAEHGQPVWKVAYHDTGDFLLSCSMDHTVKLWDMNMAKSRFTFRGHVDSVNSIQFLPYSQIFASGSGDKTVAMWDIRTSQCVQTFYGHNNAVNSSKFNIRVSTERESRRRQSNETVLFRVIKSFPQTATASQKCGTCAWSKKTDHSTAVSHQQTAPSSTKRASRCTSPARMAPSRCSALFPVRRRVS